MNSKHTPGPWNGRSYFNTLQDEIIADGRSICRVHVRKLKTIEKVAKDLSATEIDAIGEANLRLIAAAPELLEALRGLLHAFPGEYTNAPGHILNARAAIAKATGEGA